MPDIAAIKSANKITDTIGKHVRLTHDSGDEYLGLCPFHDDHKPSLAVNQSKDTYYCRACGAKGDQVSFIQDYFQLGFREALDYLDGGSSETTYQPPVIVKSESPATYSPLAAPGTVAAGERVRVYNLKRHRWVTYEPSAVYVYRAANRDVLGLVLRLDIDGKKVTPTLQYGETVDGQRGWINAPFDGHRPLYGLDRLSDRPDVPVVIVEGEKCADAASMISDCVAVTWAGGANAYNLTDWSPLYGRRCILWPDADAPGIKSMETIAADLASHGCGILLADVSGIRTKGWDIADAIQEGKDPVIWIRDHAAPWKQPADDEPPAPEYVGPQDAEEAASQQVAAASGGLSLVLSERQLADLFHKNNPDGLRYVKMWGEWLVWDSAVWKVDNLVYVPEMISRDLEQIASGLNDPKEQKRLGSRSTISAVETISRGTGNYPMPTDAWDNDPWILNTPSGIVDLKTGVMSASDPAKHCTLITNVTPDMETVPVRWIQFLNEIMDGDIDTVAYLQRMAGYFLTGTVREKMLAFAWGTGDNGKSRFIDTLSQIMGTYAKTIPIEALMAQDGNERHPTEIAMLQGVRLATAVETEEGRMWAEAKVAGLTGGDKIAARKMHQDYFEFEPQFKLLIAGNHQPQLKNVNQAMKGRLHMLPFLQSFPVGDPRRDPDLQLKLNAEAPAILGWAIKGCLHWQVRGQLGAPAAIVDFTDKYIQGEDQLGEFLADCCTSFKSDFAEPREIYRAWCQWCSATGVKPGSQKRLSTKLQERGYVQRRTGSSRFYDGIGVRIADMTQIGNGWTH